MKYILLCGSILFSGCYAMEKTVSSNMQELLQQLMSIPYTEVKKHISGLQDGVAEELQKHIKMVAVFERQSAQLNAVDALLVLHLNNNPASLQKDKKALTKIRVLVIIDALLLLQLKNNPAYLKKDKEALARIRDLHREFLTSNKEMATIIASFLERKEAPTSELILSAHKAPSSLHAFCIASEKNLKEVLAQK